MEVTNILHNIEYGKEKPAIKVLVNNPSTKEIRIIFRRGQEMKQHQTNYPIVVEIVRGAIDFGTDTTRHQLGQGSLLTLSPNIPHDLIAIDDSIIRLTLHKSDDISRVEKLLEE
ncbi:MAG: AraC family ligand binding domain-containing protein [Flavobacteriaceae bacterium]|jgi:quercetin dioxygenase-like cupin family protein|nr:AraC family ligand binding domain-containing protein [Flavobacteriaceae bacterium]